jgi:phosphoacetylglucosamine mutase
LLLKQSWEAHATSLANATDDDSLIQMYEKIAADAKVSPQVAARVIFARDTRASGSSLVAALVDALKATDAEYTDFKLLTTPQLHYLVRCENTKGTQYAYGDVSEKGYYEKLAAAFKVALGDKKITGAVTVDCANGIGGPKLRELIHYLSDSGTGIGNIKVINDDVLKPENLNMQVNNSTQAISSQLTHHSAVLTMLKLNKELHHLLKLAQESEVPLLTGMRID